MNILVSGQRQTNAKTTAAANGALRLHFRAMCGADGLDDGKSQPRTFGIGGPGLVHTIKTLKDVRQCIGRDANAVVFHLQHGVAVDGEHAQLDRPLFRCIFDGVVEQVHNHLFEPHMVAFYR